MAGPLLLFGGTFDPPHNAHLLMAACARRELGTDEVVFMPAGDPWMKSAAGLITTPARTRLLLLRRAIDGHAGFRTDDRELRRRGPSYTVDTLEELAAAGHRDIVLVLGSDAVADMHRWHRADRVLELARAVIAPKPPAASRRLTAELAPPGWQERLAARSMALTTMPPLAISSTIVRQRVAAGLPITGLVPRPVERAIERRGLYR